MYTDAILPPFSLQPTGQGEETTSRTEVPPLDHHVLSLDVCRLVRRCYIDDQSNRIAGAGRVERAATSRKRGQGLRKPVGLVQ